MIEIIVAIFLGILTGILAGLVPGLHPNIFASLVLVYLMNIDPLLLAIFLLCAGITNSFVSFIPSIFLGAPESESSLSVLPGHRLMKMGRGYEAVYLTVLGGASGGILVFITLPLLFFIKLWYEKARLLIALGLIFISSYMILTEKNLKKVSTALFVFLFSGLIGIKLICFDVFFPVFTGFFGLPLLFHSWLRKSKLPEKVSLEIEKKPKFSSTLIGLIGGILAGLFPGIGSAQASAVAQEVLRKKGDREFLVSIGAITTVDVILSVFAIYLIGNPRSGIAQAIMNLLGKFSLEILLLFIFISLSCVFLSGYITLKLSRKIVFLLEKIDYSRLCRNVFFFLFFLVFIFSNTLGVLLCITCFFLGLFTNLAGIKRTHLMGFLIIPTILIYLGI